MPSSPRRTAARRGRAPSARLAAPRETAWFTINPATATLRLTDPRPQIRKDCLLTIRAGRWARESVTLHLVGGGAVRGPIATTIDDARGRFPNPLQSRIWWSRSRLLPAPLLSTASMAPIVCHSQQGCSTSLAWAGARSSGQAQIATGNPVTRQRMKSCANDTAQSNTGTTTSAAMIRVVILSRADMPEQHGHDVVGRQGSCGTDPFADGFAEGTLPLRRDFEVDGCGRRVAVGVG